MNWLCGGQTEMVEGQRKRHHRADHHKQRRNPADRERQRQQVQLDEAALLPLFV